MKDYNDDWRSQLKGIGNLFDLDPAEVMIFYRHMYLEIAKDILLRHTEESKEHGLKMLEVAELMQQAIEVQFEPNANEYLLNLSPAYFSSNSLAFITL